MTSDPAVTPTPTPPPDPTGPPPAACAVAFKEWAGVCAGLLAGRRSLILRKGGVAEAGGTFRPEHPAFWLYPTVVHEAEQGLRPTAAGPDPIPAFDPARSVPIAALAVVEWAGRVETLEQLAALEPLHDWTEATIRGRFDYRRPGLWALAVRVYRRAEPYPLAVTPEQVGCKTWVPLDPPIPLDGAAPVLDAAESAARLDALRRALAGGGLS